MQITPVFLDCVMQEGKPHDANQRARDAKHVPLRLCTCSPSSHGTKMRVWSMGASGNLKRQCGPCLKHVCVCLCVCSCSSSSDTADRLHVMWRSMYATTSASFLPFQTGGLSLAQMSACSCGVPAWAANG